MSNPIQDILGDDYKPIKGSEIATVKNGRVAYIDLDINKPGKFFYDLTDVFNATTGEAEKELSLRILRSGQPVPLNNYKVQVDGQYPSGEDFHVTGANLQSNSPVTTFIFPLGLFQEVGEYPFQFTVTNTSAGDKETSHWCLFNVTQSATTLGIDWANGVNPYDSDYAKWKQEVIQYHQQEIDYLTGLNESASKIQKQLDSVDSNINNTIDTGWQDKLNGDNTWTGKQTFNGDLTATGNVELPNTSTVNSEFELGNVMRLDKSANGGSTVFLNKTAMDNASVKSWLWGERYNKELDRTDNPHFYLYMAFALDCNDVGKPFAQFASGFFKGANPGPITIPIGAGSAMFHVDADSDTLVLDSVSNISGKVTVGTKIWI